MLISGEIPSWVEGSLYRNGPGMFKIGEDTYKHLFDGMAVIQQYKISNGQVTYNNRLLESDCLQKNLQSNRIVVSGFGTVRYPDPCKSLFRRCV